MRAWIADQWEQVLGWLMVGFLLANLVWDFFFARGRSTDA